jgi:hypothetical protein
VRLLIIKSALQTFKQHVITLTSFHDAFLLCVTLFLIGTRLVMTRIVPEGILFVLFCFVCLFVVAIMTVPTIPNGTQLSVPMMPNDLCMWILNQLLQRSCNPSKSVYSFGVCVYDQTSYHVPDYSKHIGV